MIEIRISETGFVSGQAWETVGYEGDNQSRLLHTIFNKPDSLVNDNYVCWYRIRSKFLQKIIDINLDDENNILIPKEFMSNSQKLWFQFYVKSDDVYILKSNPFHLNIESSIEEDSEIILKPGANVFISVNSIEERDSIPRSQLADGKVVRVKDVDGETKYYSWDLDTNSWILELFGVDDISIDDVNGLADALSWHEIGYKVN